jgi:hypothetical protein
MANKKLLHVALRAQSTESFPKACTQDYFVQLKINFLSYQPLLRTLLQTEL